MALRCSSPRFMSELYFKYELGYPLDLENPQTFNEKLQWLKLYEWPNNSLAIQCADKYAVREYIRSIGHEDLLNDLFFVWDSADEIDWDLLPDQFVLKCNHGCGYNLLCSDKSKIDTKKWTKTLRAWMREDFSKFNSEPHYGKIPRKIICERYLGGDVINYNIYCFNGHVTFISIAGGLGDGEGEHLTYYNPDGSKAWFKNRDYPVYDNKVSEHLKEMEAIAEELSKPFPMVRVDLYDVDGRIILSELTFSPGGALIPFDSKDADRALGDKLDISGLISQKNR